MRLKRLVVAWLILVMATGCTRSAIDTEPEDFTTPGAATAMVERLMAAAGTTHAVSLEFTRSEARLSAVTGQQVVTYAWRNQTIALVDSDVYYVGQAIFDPRSFDLSDLGAMFDQAAAIAGSSQGQQLQITDYDSGHVYMAVTTNPDTLPVFFAPDATLIGSFDATDPDQLAPVLDSLVNQGTPVVRLGIDSASGVYVDLAAGPGQILHVVRSPRFPVRDQLKPESAPPEPFDASGVSAAMIDRILDRAAAHIGKPLSSGYTLVVQRQGGAATATATVTMGMKSTHLTLTAVVLAS